MERFDDNIILLTDSYKLSHHMQYPPGTEKVYSYFESRNGAEFHYTPLFGLQYFMRRYLAGRVVTPEGIAMAESIANLHVGKGILHKEGWEYIEQKYNGFLPIRIRAVPEGTLVPQSNVLMTVENTDPKCYWLTNYLETLLSEVWYMSTVCALSNSVMRRIKAALQLTGNEDLLPFKLHDFGFRGVSSVESAGLGGLAHLVNFKGTDTMVALKYGMEYYDSGVCGFSIPASEHSTITSWGKENEVDAFANMLDKYPTGLVACVSDSFDIGHACSELWGNQLKAKVLNREGTLVVRPDSGDIVPTVLDVLNRLGNAFGTYTNNKGYRVLNDKVRVIQGDGCNVTSINEVINAMILNGWSIDNIAFGMGGGLLQRVNRDTQRFAFKCSSITINGEERDVFKEPKGDPTKNSKRGRLALVKDENGQFSTILEKDLDSRKNELQVVFEGGEIQRLTTLEEVRIRASDVLR